MITEPLLFEISQKGRRAVSFPKDDLSEMRNEILPPEIRRKNPPKLPELSELDVVRHFTRLSQLNYSVDTHFYPLGSCTMKYNPKINEKTCSFPEFTNLHPYQNDSETQGTLELLWNLEQSLCELTGMDAFSLQPAAGAHGEFLGLILARAYFDSKNEKRSKVIVPDSAHGTNPASAALSGYSVVSVPSNEKGRITKEALEKVLDEQTALIMITCPNTLGLFEDEILEISELAHKKGALLYMDGANFNALVGLAEPAKMGFDIMHINIHKTFAVPHGGGGPGAGPVGVKKFLEEFLPVPRISQTKTGFQLVNNSNKSVGRIRSFFGNVGALIRAYTYIVSLGEDGLKSVSENSILNANYLAQKLKSLFKIHINEPCMHECVLSGNESAKNFGVKTLDIAKRLLDYGFYAPTIYFPLIVPEAMMIEPTETESKKSMDQFVQAMEKIADEIKNKPELLRTAPRTTAVRRLDEVTAARTPILKFKSL